MTSTCSSSLTGDRPIQVRFGETTFDILTDFLTRMNDINKLNLERLPGNHGDFKDRKVVEHMFLLCKEFRLDPMVGYHAIDILERFMIKHIEDLQACPSTQGASGGRDENLEELLYQSIKPKFNLILLSCVQIASKLSLHCNIVDNHAAVRYLHSSGYTITKEQLTSSELMILKALDFNLNVTNPLTYVETLIEVLGHNLGTLVLEDMYHLCHAVLQFTILQRKAMYEALLKVVTRSASPPQMQRETFMPVTEDCMLLGVAVIAVSAFILCFSSWEQVVEELTLISGISNQSITEFTYVILMHVVNNSKSLR